METEEGDEMKEWMWMERIKNFEGRQGEGGKKKK